jgi:hypothetical protein
MSGVEEGDTEESLRSVSVGEAADSRPNWKALAVGLIWQAVAPGGMSALPCNKYGANCNCLKQPVYFGNVAACT